MNHALSKIQSPIVEQTYQMNLRINSINYSLTWGTINAILVAVIFYDVYYKCPNYSHTFQNLEILALFILLINTLYHFYNYLALTINVYPVFLTPKQKKLLGIKETDNFFKEEISPLKTLNINTSTQNNFDSTPMNLSATSWQSSALMTSISSEIGVSPNNSTTCKSWTYYKSSPDRLSTSKTKQTHFSPTSNEYLNLGNSSFNEPIKDEKSLENYLKEYEELESNFKVGYSSEPTSNYFNTFWNHQRNNKHESLPIFRPCSYQLAPPIPAQTLHSPGGTSDDPSLNSSAIFNQEVWGKIKVNPQILTQWNANLRLWISQTILERLVTAMKNVNETLERQGLADMRLGTIGLERLKKTALAPQVASHVPHLPMLVPFLELSPHQEYIVTRIKELAKGGSMSEYRWNSGGRLHGKEWDEHLPTDAALIMHLLATYLDSQLPIIAKHAEGRPFSSQYLIKTPDRPPTSPSNLVIYQSQVNPPHYLLLVGDETLQVPKGRNNLFQTIILFLHQVKLKEDGMLGRVNLGRSGINMLWVIDS